MPVKNGFLRLDGEHAKRLIRTQGFSARGLSIEMNMNPTWLTACMRIGSIHRDDVKRLQEMGCDLTPALVAPSTVWTLKFDIGLILTAIIKSCEGQSVQSISNELGLDWKTIRRYIETWKETQFGLTEELLEQMLIVIRERKEEEKLCFTRSTPTSETEMK